MSFCKGMKQPLADLQPETKETASELILWHTSEDPKHGGRCMTGTDDKTHTNRFIFFVKKVSENRGTLWGWQKRSQTQYMVAPWQGRAQLSLTLAPQTRY